MITMILSAFSAAVWTVVLIALGIIAASAWIGAFIILFVVSFLVLCMVTGCEPGGEM